MNPYQTEEITQILNVLPRQSSYLDSTFLLKNIQLEMIMNELWNITKDIWNRKKDTFDKFVPQESYETKLYHSISFSVKTVQWNSVFFLTPLPEFSHPFTNDFQYIK